MYVCVYVFMYVCVYVFMYACKTLFADASLNKIVGFHKGRQAIKKKIFTKRKKKNIASMHIYRKLV